MQEFVNSTYEIIVVDNASLDGTQAEISSSFPGIKFIANAKNVGFSAANNQGFIVSTGEFVLLLNPDAKLINADLQKAVQYLGDHSKTIIGPNILNPDLSLQDSVLEIPDFKDVFVEAVFLTYFFTPNMFDTLKKNNYALSGACLMLSRQNYELLGGLDENLFWMDDVDFCYRAKQQGMSIHYFDDWSIVHVIGQSGKKNYNVSISNQLISKLKFFKKHNQPLNYTISVLLIQVHIALRVLVFLPLSPFKSMYRLKFFAYCYSQSLFFKYIFTSKKQTF